jgi:PAS domain S-box-containing protein
MSSTTTADAAPAWEVVATGRSRTLVLCLVAVAVLVALVQPFSGARLEGRPGFVPAMLALVGCLDLLSAVLLVRQFRDTGDRRSLAMGWAYLFSLAVLAGYGAAFPGVIDDDEGPLARNRSTPPWLWAVWHTGFPVLLAAAVAPWPQRWTRQVPASARARWAYISVPGCVGAGILAVAGFVAFGDRLPVLIHGTDTSAMTHVVGPVILPAVAAATVVAVLGALRLSGPPRWVGLAAAAALGDVILTLFSYHRYSLGWYVGRTLTVVSCAVVLVAMLAEFSRLKGLLALEADRLRALLARTDELEGLQRTLLEHLADGVMMQGPDGRIVACNPAIESLLEMTPERMHGRTEPNREWKMLGADGAELPASQTPASVTRRTGEPQRNQVVGIHLPSGRRRWLRINTTATRGPSGEVRYVVSSMADETDRHDARIAADREATHRRQRVETVLADGGPVVVVQPIVDLCTGRVVGGEALSRFAGPPERSPDQWFAEADGVGLGVELELAAVRAALCLQPSMPDAAYLSFNVSPAAAASPQLADLLVGFPAGVLVLELTEHADVKDYPALHQALAVLRARGVRVAVDDAGSGFASLRHILNLRPDIIKLDLALVRGIHTDPARRALATGLLAFAVEIGADIVAEGIETSAELEVLRDIGIPHGQGYHLGRPGPLPLHPTYLAQLAARP